MNVSEKGTLKQTNTQKQCEGEAETARAKERRIKSGRETGKGGEREGKEERQR